MISVEYLYWSKSEEAWKLASKEFNDVEKAIRFIILCKKAPYLKFISYSCIDSEDNEYIWSRI